MDKFFIFSNMRRFSEQLNELISEPTNLPLIQNLGVFIESRLCIIMSIDLREDDVGDIAVSILFAQFSDSSVMQRVKISISKENEQHGKGC